MSSQLNRAHKFTDQKLGCGSTCPASSLANDSQPSPVPAASDTGSQTRRAASTS